LIPARIPSIVHYIQSVIVPVLVVELDVWHCEPPDVLLWRISLWLLWLLRLSAWQHSFWFLPAYALELPAWWSWI
jgi:hypothetical protein